MGDVVNKRILAFGHSHLAALRRAYRDFYSKDKSGPAPLTCSFIALHQDVFQPNVTKQGSERKLNDVIERRLTVLLRRDKPDLIASCVMGNEYNGLAILNHPQRFDFFLPARPDLPTDETAEILPVDLVEDLIRARLEKKLALYLSMLARAKAAAAKIHIPPPPPIRDAAHIEAYPGKFGTKVAQFGVSPAFFRLKMWMLNYQVQQALCEEAGITFYHLPEGIADADGFLVQALKKEDPTHGNVHYGKIILDDVARRSFPRSEMEKARGRTPV